MRSRAMLYARVDADRNHSVAITSGGRIDAVITASVGSMNTSATPTPTNVTRLTSALTRPFCKSCESASMSVVMRVMIRPAISCS
jgi:hypothetical protein